MDYAACRFFVAALLRQAVRDARRGSGEAKAWLFSEAAKGWADFLDLERWPPVGL